MTIGSVFIAHYRETDGATQPLSQHLLAVAARTRNLSRKLGLAQAGELLGLLHDLGKYSSEFQAYLKSAVGLLDQDTDEDFVDAKGLKGKVDHSTAGAQVVWRELSKHGQLGEVVGQILALCLASHHSGLIDCLTSAPNSFGENAFTRRMTKPVERTHLLEAMAQADETVLLRVRALLSDPATIACVRDAIGNILTTNPARSDKTPVTQQQIGLLVRFLFSCLIDADRTDTADFERPGLSGLRSHVGPFEWSVLVSRLESHLEKLQPTIPIDDLRREVSDHCRDAASRGKGVYSLTVPTGGGKTLASLRFALRHANAHGADRVIYFIPFTSIIDQNAGEVRRILEPSGIEPSTVVLEHHSNLTPEGENWRAQIRSENWNAPVIFTTNVQCLEALFASGTRSARRMHQLTNAVLIFDEVQTLPLNCIHLFNNAINFLVDQCGSTVVLCTATQPLLDKVDSAKGAVRIPAGNELMPDVRILFDKLRRVEVTNRREPGGWAPERITALALEEAARVGSCLVVVNTKEAARTLYRLSEGQTDASIYHLSTNMCPAHRKEVLAEIRLGLDPLAPKQILCFSTQLIEAGVDMDFGSVIRFAAGLDSVAQAAGRCNRHGRRPTGRVHVINPRDENLERLADIRIGRDIAARVFDDFDEDPGRFDGNLLGPQAMEWYYRNYFFARAGDMDYSVSSNTLGHDDTLLNLLSVNSMAVHEHGQRTGQEPALYLRQSFMAAARAFKSIDAPTRGVVVPYGKEGHELVVDLCAAFLPEKEFKLLRRAQQFSVNVFPHVLDRLVAVNAVREVAEGTGILILNSQYYSPKFGLSESPVAEMEFLNG